MQCDSHVMTTSTTRASVCHGGCCCLPTLLGFSQLAFSSVKPRMRPPIVFFPLLRERTHVFGGAARKRPSSYSAMCITVAKARRKGLKKCDSVRRKCFEKRDTNVQEASWRGIGARSCSRKKASIVLLGTQRTSQIMAHASGIRHLYPISFHHN